MDLFSKLGLALGLASLAGVNLYLTVFLVGTAVRFQFLHLDPGLHSLDVLAHPAVIIVSGLLFAAQFFADKIPWVDSLWDSVHTIIRPVGGALLALEAMGTMPGYMKVVAALLAGGAALTTHSAKAGTRLLINHSPEPVTNVATSLAEEAAVGGGVVLTLLNPIVALLVFSSLLVTIWVFFPRLWRAIRATLWLVWQKLKLPGRREQGEERGLKRELDDELRDLLRYLDAVSPDEVEWTAPCLSGRSRGVHGLSSNLQGTLVGTTSRDRIYFASIRGRRSRAFILRLDAVQVEEKSRFLSEDVILSGGAMKAAFRFARGEDALAEAVAVRIRQMCQKHEIPGRAVVPHNAEAARPAPVPLEGEAAVAQTAADPPVADGEPEPARSPNSPDTLHAMP